MTDKVETFFRDLPFIGKSQGDSQEIPWLEIRPTSGWFCLDLRELWAYRELAYFLAWREIKVRYKQTAIGVAWAVLQPLAMMQVFTVFFGKLVNLPSDGIPYPLFTFAALLPWQLFSRTITECTNSLVADQRRAFRNSSESYFLARGKRAVGCRCHAHSATVPRLSDG
jgi:hypothetical protein